MNEPRPNFSHAMPAAEPQEAGLSPAGLAKLTAIMQREIDAKRLPGVSMLIARRGKIGYRRDLGALRPGGPAMPGNAIYRVYSMTKPIVSTALMMLVEDGRLFIADPVAKYIPDFADPKVGVEKDGKLELVPARRPITIQDLLRHTSGLTYGFTGNSAVQRLYLERASATLMFPAPRWSPPSPSCRSCSSRGPRGTTAIRPTWSGASSRSSPGRAWAHSCGKKSLRRSA